MIQVTTPLGSSDCVRLASTSMGSTWCHASLSSSGSSSLSPSSETILPKKGDGVESPGMARSQGIKAIGPTGYTNSIEIPGSRINGPIKIHTPATRLSICSGVASAAQEKYQTALAVGKVNTGIQQRLRSTGSKYDCTTSACSTAEYSARCCTERIATGFTDVSSKYSSTSFGLCVPPSGFDKT